VPSTNSSATYSRISGNTGCRSSGWIPPRHPGRSAFAVVQTGLNLSGSTGPNDRGSFSGGRSSASVRGG
jgi:hypothetical protein